MSRTRRLVASISVATTALVAVVEQGSDAAPDNPLPFEMPSAGELDASGRRVYAHYIPVFPISIDNEPPAEDYYAEHFLTVDGERGKHVEYGGFLRSRPLPREVNPAPDWALTDMRTDVARAVSAGFDGFVVDVFSLEGSNWDRVVLLLDAAAQVDPEFDIVLAPGTNTGAADDLDALADSIAGLADHPSAAHDSSGRLVVAPFLAELLSADEWSRWIELMRQRGVEVALVPILLDDAAHADEFAPISEGLSSWGSRSLAAVPSLARSGRAATDLDRFWMQPVAMQDTRPKEGRFQEADNTETLRAMWATADEVDAQWVNFVSWNDYSEGTQIAPSTGIDGWLLDLNAYFLVTYKMGEAPPIVNDRIFVSHRIQRVDTPPTGGQTLLMEPHPGSSPPNDEVEVLTFLRDGAQVEVRVGASTYRYDAPDGVHAERFPLEEGAISAVAIAPDGITSTVASPYPVIADPVVQDFEYRVVGSGTAGETQGVPPVTTVPATTAAPTTAPAATTPPTEASTGPTNVAPVPAPPSGGSGSSSGEVPWWPFALGALVVLLGVVAWRRRGRQDLTTPAGAGSDAAR